MVIKLKLHVDMLWSLLDSKAYERTQAELKPMRMYIRYKVEIQKLGGRLRREQQSH